MALSASDILLIYHFDKHSKIYAAKHLGGYTYSSVVGWLQRGNLQTRTDNGLFSGAEIEVLKAR